VEHAAPQPDVGEHRVDGENPVEPRFWERRKADSLQPEQDAQEHKIDKQRPERVCVQPVANRLQRKQRNQHIKPDARVPEDGKQEPRNAHEGKQQIDERF